MEGKILGITVGIILVSIVVLGFGVFYGGISTSYGATYNQNISRYNQMSQINNLTVQLSNETKAEPNSILGGQNIIGDFLYKGYTVSKLLYHSYDYFSAMLNYAIEGTPWGDGGTGSTISLIFSALGSIIFIVFVFAIIKLLTGRGDI